MIHPGQSGPLRRARDLLLIAAVATFAIGTAQAQSTLLQGGPWTAGHAPMYVGQGSAQAVVQDSGPAGGGALGLGLSELLLTARGAGAAPHVGQGTGPLGTNLCDYDGPINNATGYHYLCFSANAGGGGLLAYGAGGGAAQLPLTMSINGTAYPFPFVVGGIVGPSTTVVGDLSSWANTAGTLLNDTGIPASKIILGAPTTVIGDLPLWNNGTGTLLSDSGVPLSSVALLASPHFTGVPTAPTAAPGTNTTQLATTAFADAAVAAGQGNAASKNVYVSTTGSDSNSGLSWGVPFLTLQAGENAASPGGIVYVGTGTYTLAATLHPQPGVVLACSSGAKITQPNASSFATLIDFTTNAANGAAIQGCTISSNRAGNSDNGANVTVMVGTANDISITSNDFTDSNSNPVFVTTGARPKITGNTFTNFFATAVSLVPAAVNTSTDGNVSDNIFTMPIGQHAISLNGSDGNTICRNKILGVNFPGMVVNVSGTAVAWVSGPNFSGLTPGQFVVVNDGTNYQELLIGSVSNPTNLTLTAAATAATGAHAIAGPGDLLGTTSSSNNLVCDNFISGSATINMGFSNFGVAETVQGNVFSRNISTLAGAGCFQSEGTTNGGSGIFDNSIVDNTMIRCGQGGAASFASNNNAGIVFFDFSPVTSSEWVDGNKIFDISSPTMNNWMSLPGVQVGGVSVGKNTSINTASNGILNGISSIALGAGWGSTATTSNIVSNGSSFAFTVTSSGTGQTANPSLLVNTVATTAENPPQMACTLATGSNLGFVFGQSTASISVIPISVAVTPSAGQSFQILCK